MIISANFCHSGPEYEGVVPGTFYRQHYNGRGPIYQVITRGIVSLIVTIMTEPSLIDLSPEAIVPGWSIFEIIIVVYSRRQGRQVTEVSEDLSPDPKVEGSREDGSSGIGQTGRVMGLVYTIFNTDEIRVG